MIISVCRIVKIAAFLLLLIAFVLPLSRCSTENLFNRANQSTLNEPSYRYNYAWSRFDVELIGTWLIIIAFIWPIPFLLYSNLSKNRQPKVWMLVVEIILAASSICMVYFYTFYEQLWYGGYIAYFSFGLYLIVCIIELIFMLRNIIIKSRSVSKN
jgi:TRAP-type uncharacterized transport system fused permease subunit